MSIVCCVKCDGCGCIAVTNTGSPSEARKQVYGWPGESRWEAGYINRPYAGKRADFCERCKARGISKRRTRRPSRPRRVS